MVRPTTLNNKITPATETTPRANHTQAYNQAKVDELIMSEIQDTEQAMATAADANLDYIKISAWLFDVLQDAEDIMTNQMTNIFQLSNWVASIVDLFSLKVCDAQEWKSFSKHYNGYGGK